MEIETLKASVHPLIELAIKEDIGTGDISSKPIFNDTHISRAQILSKDQGIFCGGMIPQWVYDSIDPSIEITVFAEEGQPIKKKDLLIDLVGKTASILAGERITLNFLQRSCGIASRTHTIVNSISNTGIQILDTRKTLPGYRLLDKYCVKTGGGKNHRLGLYDMVMIKDNHISAAGGIIPAVEKIRARYGNSYIIEVETSTLDEVSQALHVLPDIIMLDNMKIDEINSAIQLINGKCKIEISGNITESSLKELSILNIDYISIGALTHSVTAFDLSMKFTGA